MVEVSRAKAGVSATFSTHVLTSHTVYSGVIDNIVKMNPPEHPIADALCDALHSHALDPDQLVRSEDRLLGMCMRKI